MKTTINSTMRDGGNVIVSASFEFSEKEWTAEEAEAAVRGFTADRQAGMVASLAAMSEEDKRIAKMCGVSPQDFARYNPAKPQPKVRFGVGR